MSDICVSTSGANPTGVQQTSNRRGASYVSSTSTATASTAAAIAADSARNLATNSLAASGHSSASSGAAVSTSLETMVPLSAFAHYRAGPHAAQRQSSGTVCRGDDFLQSCVGAGPSARRRRRSRTQSNASECLRPSGAPSPAPRRPISNRSRACRCFSPRRWGRSISCWASSTRAYIHPITILSTLLSASVGAAAGALGVQHRIYRHRRDRRAAVDRHRQEERDHDGRLRARSGAGGTQHARRDRRRLACCASVRS